MMALDTSTDPRRFTWAIQDQVIRLRQWATGEFLELDPVQARRARGYKVGSVKECDLRLKDRTVSKEHARVTFEEAEEAWRILDLGSKNGIRIDGVRVEAIQLAPGMEVGLGKTTLLVESMRSIGLRCFLARLLGWAEKRQGAVDLALRDLRQAQLLRHPIALRGDGNLVPVAYDLHRFLFGPEAPFVVCDPYRRTGEASARGLTNIEDGAAALEASRGGTLCIRNDKLPKAFDEILDKAHNAEGTDFVQVLLCDDGSRKARVEQMKLIKIPPLSARPKTERRHVVTEYAAEAVQDLRANRQLSGEDQVWVLKHCGTSLAEIGKGTRRLLALRLEGTLAGAARRVGMATPALRRWFADRAFPKNLRAEDAAAIAAEPAGYDA
jgi:FHA domain